MDAADVFAGIVVGVLSPILLPIAIVYAVVTVTIDIIREKVQELKAKKGLKSKSAVITEMYKSGKYNIVKIGLLDEEDHIIEKLEIKGKKMSPDIRKGVRIAV